MSEPQTAVAQREAKPQEKLMIVSPGRPPYPTRAQAAFGISPGDWRALVDAVFPAAKTTEAVELALSYCRARGLDPFKRPVHIVPIWDSKKGAEVETVWPGIGELRTTAARTGQMAGCEDAVFGPDQTRTFKGTIGKGQYAKEVEKTVTFPEWCQLIVYRMVQGIRVPFPGPKVRWMETYATMGASDVPNEMWATRPYGQLEKCAEAAALRRAFPEEVGGDLISDEVGRRVSAIDITPSDPQPAGSKTAGLAARLAAAKAPPATADPEEVQPQDVGGEAFTPAASQEGERLTEGQVSEIRDLINHVGVSLDDIEGQYGAKLEEICVQGLDSKALEADIVKEVRDRAAAKREREGQLPLGEGKKGR